MKKMQKGFTLIELMIVVAIIAILAAIAIPAYQDYLVRTQVSEGAVLADGAKTAVAEWYSNKGTLASTGGNLSMGLATPASITGKYVSSVTVAPATGIISSAYGGPKASTKIPATAILVVSPQTTAGSVSWVCKSTTINAKYLPTSCR
jgi:type IV pilus assembly protein PilA